MAIRHVTLTANAPMTVNSPRDARDVGITHTGNVTNPVYVRVDGTAPTIEGDDCYVVLPGQNRILPRLWSLPGPTDTKIISAGAAKVEVEFS